MNSISHAVGDGAGVLLVTLEGVEVEVEVRVLDATSVAVAVERSTGVLVGDSA